VEGNPPCDKNKPSRAELREREEEMEEERERMLETELSFLQQDQWARRGSPAGWRDWRGV
jgi:hypothetical protein